MKALLAKMRAITFPHYFPKGARTHVRENLALDQLRIDDRSQELAKINARLSSYQQRLHSSPDAESAPDCRQHLDELRRRRMATMEELARLQHSAGVLHRLSHAEEMGKAYELLATAFRDDSPEEQDRKIDGFVSAAWVTAIDFTPHRDQVENAEQLRGEIAKCATRLAELLRAIDKTWINIAPELDLLPALLRRAESSHQYRRWRALRGILLGDAPSPEDEEKDTQALFYMLFGSLIGDQSSPANAAREPDGPGGVTRALLLAAWHAAPRLPDLLDALTEVAQQFQPSETGFVAAAIASQKRTPAPQYLRAFATELVEEHHFAETLKALLPKVKEAMAVTAAVVLGDTSGKIDYETVRKTLTNMKIRTQPQ